MIASRGRSRRWSTTVLAVATAGALALAGCGSDDDHDGHEHTGSDDHEHIDPVAQDPAIAATSVAVTALSWTAAEQSSPWDIPTTVLSSSMTGELADKASDPSSAEARRDRPSQWDGWATAGATVKAFVLETEVTEESDSATTVVTTVRQDLSYPDGGGSTWKTTDYEIDLVAEDGRWKATTMKEKS
ncbi:hypothetical protein ACT3SZ_14895 [Corynebacterium sp. AOP40-9SA-29]|uniref:hypothetical protein n=1 Tax=Corynebacterium sp. AOP40-9SA-29 TaxID=3457677 RepID=UPI0040344810